MSNRMQITNEQIEKAYVYAERKQQWIYIQTQRPEVLEDWYLEQLVCEIIAQNAFSDYCLMRCREMRNAKKEALTTKANTPSTRHSISNYAPQIKDLEVKI